MGGPHASAARLPGDGAHGMAGLRRSAELSQPRLADRLCSFPDAVFVTNSWGSPGGWDRWGIRTRQGVMPFLEGRWSTPAWIRLAAIAHPVRLTEARAQDPQP